jgi:hypothetical protein
MIREIDDAVLDQRLCLLAAIIGHTVGPGRHQPFDVIAIDVCERTEAVLAVTHPIGEHVGRSLFVVRELVRGLGERLYRECRVTSAVSRMNRLSMMFPPRIGRVYAVCLKGRSRPTIRLWRANRTSPVAS